jgi:C4-dicarboxylate-specific signal transduction histidine kinase
VNGDAHSKLPKVLVADDEPDMLHFIGSQLAGHYNVIYATNGEEAVQKATASVPDLILTDMMMPGKDGVQVCKELRQHPATKSVPIVMITARADEETKLAALNSGANDFLPKPFSTTELHVRVKNLLESHQFQRGLEQQNQKLEAAYTELRQTQDQLITKEKQASLGVWSAGIIHEINNPLNFARTGLYALRNKSKLLPEPERPDFNELVADIEDGVQRVHTIVSDLRTYAHPGREACEDVSVQDAVRVALRFFSADLQGYAEITLDIPAEQTIYANRNKLIQVLANLLQNALDAMRMKKFTQGHPALAILGRVENGRTQLIVRDNGPGIAREHLDKIFDPFFTTKDVGLGMGLGLGICYRIVQEFGGRITVKTEPGEYCEFTLDFPVEQPVTKEN